MKKQNTILMGILAALVLSGCGGSSRVTAWKPTNYERELKVKRLDSIHRVHFSSDRTQTSANEKRKLTDYIIEHGDPSVLWVSINRPNQTQASYKRAHYVKRTLARTGVPVNRISIETPHKNSIPNADFLTVNVARYGVQLPNCPNFSSPESSALNHDTSNFGCAQVSNLGMMVHDPRDFAYDRGFGPAEATREVGALERYRTDKVKKLIQGSFSVEGSGSGS